jgi:glycosidase
MGHEIHVTDIKLVYDLVPNHSSDLNEWFQKSVNLIDPYTEFQAWHDAKINPKAGRRVCEVVCNSTRLLFKQTEQHNYFHQSLDGILYQSRVKRPLYICLIKLENE